MWNILRVIFADGNIKGFKPGSLYSDMTHHQQKIIVDKIIKCCSKIN
jgi:hypothetical protein